MYLARQAYAKKKEKKRDLESFSLFAWCILGTVAWKAASRVVLSMEEKGRLGKAKIPNLRWKFS